MVALTVVTVILTFVAWQVKKPAMQPIRIKQQAHRRPDQR